MLSIKGISDYFLDFRRYKSPFLAIQYAVDSAILQKHTNRTNITTVAETRVYMYLFIVFYYLRRPF